MSAQNKSKISRNVFSTANTYQNKIILLCFLPSVVTFLAFSTIVFIGNPIITKAVYHQSIDSVLNLVYGFTGAIVFVLCLLVLLSVMSAFVISHHIVGPFGRIMKELDDIIDGKSQRKITSRPGDDLARDLLQRVNVLVDSYVKQKSQYNKD